jgi:predicted transposase/invertase (TIGR01784 family)
MVVQRGTLPSRCRDIARDISTNKPSDQTKQNNKPKQKKTPCQEKQENKSGGKQQHYADRLRVYTSLATVQNLKHGDNDYIHVPRVYSFNIMSCNMLEFEGRERFFWSIYPKDNDNEIFSKNIVYYFVELSKFAAQLESLDMGDERNRLLYMFTHVVYMPEQEFKTLTPMQQRFYEECQITNFTDMEKQGYVKSLMEHEDVREMVECEREDARKEGREEGRAEERRKIFASLLEHGFDVRGLADAAGITEEEVLAAVRG